jgi:hypothetical protein
MFSLLNMTISTAMTLILSVLHVSLGLQIAIYRITSSTYVLYIIDRDSIRTYCLLLSLVTRHQS